MKKITYGAAIPADADEIFRLCTENMEEYEDIASLDYEKVKAWIKRKIDKYISEYTRIYEDGVLCGYYRFHEDGDMYELDDLYLLEGYRGRGIGTRVMSDMLGKTEAASYLYVFKRNAAALALYEKFGFKVKEDLGTRYIMERRC
ncbi:MAG: GNAT family N-acetyltransferase [Clostridia bacterium]|nr:GNAT family N-acetyltransferase [Clostridia bacterium]